MKKALAFVLTFGMMAALTACSPVSPPDVQKYVLSPERYATMNRRPRTHKTLLINNMVANEAYSTNKMIYLNFPFSLKAFSRNEWVAPPAQMLQSMVGDRVLSRHYFKAVVFSPFVGNTDYILSLRLLILQQEFLQPLSQEHLALRAVLINGHNNRVVAERVFQSVLPAPGNNPYGGVLAANKMANEISDEVARFVVSSV